LNYALIGYGRMGRAIEAEAEKRGHACVARRDASSSEILDRRALNGAAVAFEFSIPAGAESNVVALLEAGCPVVCGTTGWEPGPRFSAALAAAEVGAVLAPNFSIGMNLFLRLVRHAGELLGGAGQHEPFVFEAHHRGKRDAPSGTARLLGKILVESDPRLEGVQVGCPDGARPANRLQIASVRAGAEAGTHVVGFDGPADRITLEHRARGRQGFALGAVIAAEWLEGRRGLHSFEPVLQSIVEGVANGS